MARVRLVRSDIEASLSCGHSLKRICEDLNADGFAIDYKTLSTCLGVLRRTEDRDSVGPQNGARRTHTAALPKPPLDPMANARQYSTGKRPGFHFTGEPPDPAKLF
jgi:hypothetical protein